MLIILYLINSLCVILGAFVLTALVTRLRRSYDLSEWALDKMAPLKGALSDRLCILCREEVVKMREDLRAAGAAWICPLLLNIYCITHTEQFDEQLVAAVINTVLLISSFLLLAVYHVLSARYLKGCSRFGLPVESDVAEAENKLDGLTAKDTALLRRVAKLQASPDYSILDVLHIYPEIPDMGMLRSDLQVLVQRKLLKAWSTTDDGMPCTVGIATHPLHFLISQGIDGGPRKKKKRLVTQGRASSADMGLRPLNSPL